MKKILSVVSLVMLIATMVGCNGKKAENSMEGNDSIEVMVQDTAVYGIVGEGTTMHVLELLTDEGKTVLYEMDTDSLSDIQGGIFAGDRITVIVAPGSDMPQVVKAVNMTTLLGKWTALDRNFEIKEDGVVESPMKTETHPYTHWQMVNASLVLNADTFSVLQLASDSLALENANGIFVYKRQGKEK